MNNGYKKSNFGAAFFFLSKEQKEALSIIYTFCRLADDIVDETPKTAPAQIADLYIELERVFAGNPKTELGKDFKKVLAKYPIPKKCPFLLLEGVERDLHTPVRYRKQEELNWYMYRVASAVGLMCIEVFGYKNPQTKEYAKTLGYAVQMTNIIRDIAEDAKNNRIYLPSEDLKKFKVSEEDILGLKDTQEVRELISYEIDKTQKLYDEARTALPQEDFKSMLAARAMGEIYENILFKIKKNPCFFQEKKIKLSKVAKLLILFRTWRAK